MASSAPAPAGLVADAAMAGVVQFSDIMPPPSNSPWEVNVGCGEPFDGGREEEVAGRSSLMVGSWFRTAVLCISLELDACM